MLEESISNRTVFIQIANLDKATKAGIRMGMYNLGKNLKETASKDMLKRDKTGRIYRYKGRRHRASARGETAANRSGRMRKSLDFQVQGTTSMQFGANTPYAKILEEKLDRPTLKNAMNKNKIIGKTYIEQGIASKQ